MLKEICFRLKKETMDRLRGKLEPLLADLAAHDVRVSGLQAAGQSVDNANKKEEIMYLTDQGKYYDMLRAQGCLVLPFFHEKNCGERFLGAAYAVEKLEELDFASLDMIYRRLASLPWEILETGRLLVRETTVGDVESFYRIYEEPSVTKYMEGLPADRNEEIAYTREYIEKVYAFYNYGMWTVLEKAGGEIIGRAGISWREGYDLPELGFVIGVPWQGRGYAFEVCRGILEYAREALEMKEIQALVRPGNERSVRLCGKLGFALDGETVVEGVRHLVFTREL